MEFTGTFGMHLALHHENTTKHPGTAGLIINNSSNYVIIATFAQIATILPNQNMFMQGREPQTSPAPNEESQKTSETVLPKH